MFVKILKIFIVVICGCFTIGCIENLSEPDSSTYIVAGTISALIVILLVLSLIHKKTVKSLRNNSAPNMEDAIHELATDMVDRIKIVTPPLTAQQQRDYEAVLKAEHNSPNPKFHRSEREDDLSFQFQEHWGEQTRKLENAFDDKYGEAIKCTDYITAMSLLNETLTLYKKAKAFCYNKSKGGQIYFQDMWEYMNNSSNESFSFEDQVLERIEYYEQMIKLEKELNSLVESRSGNLLQKDIYQLLPTYGKGDIQKAIRNLEDKGELLREKKGSTYLLSQIDASIQNQKREDNDMALFQKNKNENIMDNYERVDPSEAIALKQSSDAPQSNTIISFPNGTKVDVYELFYMYGSDRVSLSEHLRSLNIFRKNRDLFTFVNHIYDTHYMNFLNWTPTRRVNRFMEIDDDNKRFAIATLYGTTMSKTKICDVCHYSELLSYELLEDGNEVISGGLGRAAVGALTFGGVGAVVGGVTGKKTSKREINSLRIKITKKDINRAPIYINLVILKIKSTSLIYKQAYNEAQQILSTLDQIANICEETQQSQCANNKPSPIEEIKAYKELFDEGIITQEEFDAKKKALLDI